MSLILSGSGASFTAKATSSFSGFLVKASGGTNAWANLGTCGVTVTDTRKGGGSRQSIPVGSPIGIVQAGSTFDGGKQVYSATHKIAILYFPVSGEKDKSYLVDNGSSVSLDVTGLGVSDTVYEVFALEQPQLSDVLFTIEPFDFNNGIQKRVSIDMREGCMFPVSLDLMQSVTFEFRNLANEVAQNAIVRLQPEIIQESIEHPNGGGMLVSPTALGLTYDQTYFFAPDESGNSYIYFDLNRYRNLSASSFVFQPASGASGKIYIMDLKPRNEFYAV